MIKFDCIFCGTPDFALPTLELLHHHPHIVIKKVITMPDRPAGRGKSIKSPAVANFCNENKIPLLQTPNINKEEKLIKELEKEPVDFFLVLAFSQFLGPKILNISRKGCFNIHTSLLPKYRGASPIQYALLNGDTTTGVSIQKMVKKMDAGDIVRSDAVAIEPTETGGQLSTRLKFQAALSTNSFIRQMINNDLEFITQNHDEATFAPTLKKKDGFIDFENEIARDIFNKVRGLSPWPGTFFYLNNKRVKILEVQLSERKLNPKEVFIDDQRLEIGTKKESIWIKEIQFEGKMPVSDSDFVNSLKSRALRPLITDFRS